MKKNIKRVLIIVPLILIALVSFIVINSYFEHRKLIAEEKEKYPAPGQMVEVNGTKLHIYAEGEGKQTLVFMSGLGTVSPYYDFKVLFEKLAADYRIAVVERAGYGWSEISSTDRDLKTVLNETRTALKLSGEKAPYILFPHSLAGLEAIYWANLYPEEIEAIIGLDPLVPGVVEKSEEGPFLSPVITFLTRTGLVRHQPEVFDNNFEAAKKDLLTAKEAQIARTIFYRRVQTKNMWKEVDMVTANSKTVSEQGKLEIPFSAFISSQNEKDYWQESITSYARATNGQTFILDGSHYIHLDYPELIAEKSKEIIEKTIKN
ncbi:pimeloyl-ACP methyl ester carboxylesterase [Halanaerobium saccharolyticum]|uniref:Pimeloyl-ACP methyl ester carboxylesterase n=1 Tax=Halanaerobium saccharolyticum TaxID=43595 RepID=A0A4V3D004_9FIRM|nr:alpha/beta hydrolase [Halanaerobium saccharolyticum]TDQ01671.1 pimeloyl-ACP methyl ester carboxylesterase [Halanaerobium saccharolyticum]